MQVSVLLVVIVGAVALVMVARVRRARAADRREHPRAIGQALARAADTLDGRGDGDRSR